MNVLSLFDGISCGQVALERAGIKVDNYFASEIKPYAIKVTQDNYPNTFQLGDITKIRYKDGILYSENGEFNAGKIDLLIGGSPCQDFSHANKNITGLDGKKSSLFYEYLRLLKEINPTYFLLENVKMKKEHENKITELLAVKPILIDSQLVCGALRKRNYWTNIPNVTQPIDRKIMLQDVLEDGYCNMKKARTLCESDSRPNKTPVKIFHRYQKFNTVIFKSKEHYEQCKEHYNKNFKGLPAKEIIYDGDIYNGIRFLNRHEREKLQTLPFDYCKLLTDNEVACVCGDGWTVDVIAHIFRGLKYMNN